MQRLSKPLKVGLVIALFAVAAGLWWRNSDHLRDALTADAAPAYGQPSDPNRPNGFDISNATIPKQDILSRGPPRDGIPAIDEPKFQPAGQVTFLKDDDLVVSFTAGSLTRAYPLRVLVWHEIVNDEFGGQAIAATYCPLCGTAMVFNRRLGERTLSFGVSGLLYQSDVLMYDRQTESLWSQLAMKSVAGPQVNAVLEWLPSQHLTWAAWKKRHPDGEVLTPDTGYHRNYGGTAYAGYEEHPETMFPVPKHRDELPNKAWVAGVIVGATAKAYPLAALPSGQDLEDEIEGQRLRLRFDAATGEFRAAHARDGNNLPFVKAYWFAWQAFYPQTLLWTNQTNPP